MEFSAVNTIWVLVGAALVFFMQAGFAPCAKQAMTRAKNTGNILMKNLMDFCIGTPAFWLVGFGIMFGSGTALSSVGFDPLITRGLQPHFAGGRCLPIGHTPSSRRYFVLHAATIVSGSMAERTKFSAYCIYSAANFPDHLSRFPATGSGAAAGLHSLASMISQVPRRYIWWAAFAALIGATDPWAPYWQVRPRTASLVRFRATT